MKTKIKARFLTTVFLAFFVLSSTIAKEPFTDAKTVARVEKKYGKFAKKRVLALLRLIKELEKPGVKEFEKIKKVNAFFNKVRYVEDIDAWGKKDYWANIYEFLGKDMGDCEDYVIAKYFTLKYLGVPTKKLFFTYVKAKKFNRAHMVLSYFKKPKRTPLVLDSINNRILPATKRRDLVPVFSFNGDKLFLAKQKGLGRVVPSGMKKVKQWDKLMQDINRNKI